MLLDIFLKGRFWEGWSPFISFRAVGESPIVKGPANSGDAHVTCGRTRSAATRYATLKYIEVT